MSRSPGDTRRADLSADEALAEKLLRFFGLEPVRPTLGQTQRGKAPDFTVYTATGGLFYAELKTIKATLNGTIGDGMTPQKARMVLSRDIQKAVKQFDAVNPSRLVPNVMLWMPRNPQLSAHNFSDLLELQLTGGRPFELTSLLKIDLHIFVHPWGRPDLFYTQSVPAFSAVLRRCFSEERLSELNTPEDLSVVLERDPRNG